MTLGDYIRCYRKKENLSQREFAIKCNLSNGYISMLERGLNPKTKEPITPSLNQLKKIADGMGVTVNDILLAVDDMPVDVGLNTTEKLSPDKPEPTERESKILEAFRTKTPAEQKAFLTLLGISED